MALIVTTGEVTSWAGSGLENHLIATGIAPYTYQLTQNTGTADTTPFSVAGIAVASHAPGYRSWGGSMAGRFPKAGGDTGARSGVTTFTGSASNAYTTNIMSWVLTMTAAAEDTTPLNVSGVADAEFSPFHWSWAVTMTAKMDDAAALMNSDAAAAWQAANSVIDLKLNEGGTEDSEFGGSGIITGYTYGQTVGAVSTVDITFQGTGALTGNGDASVIPVGAIVAPAAGSLVLTQKSGSRTATGDAFLTGVTISVPGPGAALDVSATFQGTGALTFA